MFHWIKRTGLHPLQPNDHYGPFGFSLTIDQFIITASELIATTLLTCYNHSKGRRNDGQTIRLFFASNSLVFGGFQYW
ncbi:hypothetical protein FJO98_06600 [Enterococcus sp. PF-2]|nr:hypothetical protein CXM95_06745 [Enterococcus sp. CR-Ec1]EPH60727.1 hypothetical protein D931_03067 [Enterococcus faecium 13.SD.W.09]EPH90163.1 hypothetical protein D922_03146 [Enterococcus faecalis 06-MB-DW-09]TPE03685.1 hypothetical protein FJP08_09100 [Enterococcus sp. PF-3]TPE27113.1 hypothetical protein FJO98_06600 [Enterococcus sp. PF-2]